MNERPLVDDLTNDRESPAGQYMRIFVGDSTPTALVRYELVAGLLGVVPGAMGYWLRSRTYPWILGKVGQGALFGRSMVLRCPGRILIGERVLIDDHVVLDAKGETSTIQLGSNILVGRHTILSCNKARITIGDYASIGPFCFFASKNHITVGMHVSIGSGAQLLAGTHAFDDPDRPVSQQARIANGITIEDNVWIGTGAKILDGVTVGRNSIIGVDSVVNKDVPPWTVVLGNPARVIQKRKASTEML